jgi:hypothetical protein
MSIQDLQYFVGRAVTIFTKPINRDFKQESPTTYPQPLYNYFMGILLQADEHGILLQQVTPERLRSYFLMENCIGIAEEQTMDVNDPGDAKKIQKIKEESKTQVELPTTGQFIDIKGMQDLSRHLSEKSSPQ